MPRQSFQHSAHTPASIARVWTFLQQAEVWGDIAGADAVSDARHSPGGDLTGFGFVATVAGRPFRGSATVQGNGISHMTTTIQTTDLGGVISLDLEAVGHSTAIHVTLEAHSRSFLAGVAFGSIASAIGRGLPGRVDRLASMIHD
ncbi:MAG TPA: hypothetical protein VIY70_10200 [Acidimicrobiia bacterium]